MRLRSTCKRRTSSSALPSLAAGTLNLKCLVTGVVLCVFPYFVTSVILMWVITAACVGGLYWWMKSDA